jgi:hypothetical protein
MAELAALAAKGLSAMKGAGLAKTLQVGGTLLSSVGAIQAGNNAARAAEFNARELEEKGKAERAIASKKAVEKRRRKEIVLSRARAVAAASGGGQDLDLLGDLEEEGEYNAQMAIWQGEEAARGRKNQAGATRFEGRMAKRASRFKAASTLLDGFGDSLAEKYA